MLRSQLDKLESVHFNLLRRMLGCPRATPWIDVLEQARVAGCKILPLESVIKKRSLRYWGHITRMNKKQLHRMIAGACRKKPPNGKLHLGDVLDDSLFAFDIDVRDWEKHAQKIPATATRPEYSPWGGIVDDGMHRFTARWVNKLVRARCVASAVELRVCQPQSYRYSYHVGKLMSRTRLGVEN